MPFSVGRTDRYSYISQTYMTDILIFLWENAL